MAAGCSPGSRSLRGQSPLSCFLRWVFTGQSMKTTNAENDGKATDPMIDFYAETELFDIAEMFFLQTLRRLFVTLHAFTAPGSTLRAKFDNLIDKAIIEIEAVDSRVGEEKLPWPTLKEWLSLPAFAFQRFPAASTLYVIYLLELAFLVARAYGWL